MAAHAVAGLAACAFVFSRSRRFAASPGCSNPAACAPAAAAGAVRADSRFAVDPARPSGPRGPARVKHRRRLAFAALLPPLWFLGLEEVLIGRTEAVFAGLARTGLVALAASMACAALVHVCALFLRSHRTGAGAGSPTSPRDASSRPWSIVSPASSRPTAACAPVSLHGAHADPQSASPAVSRRLTRRRIRGRGGDNRAPPPPVSDSCARR